MSENSEIKVFSRLPTSVVPNNYVICLKPNLETFIFSGTESVNITVREETNVIVLNALEIDITSVSFTAENGKCLNAEKIEISVEDETARLEFSQTLTVGNGILNIDFTGILNDKLKGFYRSKYLCADSLEERYAAVTQFAPTDARRAFPCWDEPAIKATFDITLIVPKNRIALSNMNVISETDARDDPKNLKEVTFATTPVMSTYLFACIVGEFDYIEEESRDGVTVRVYTPVGKKDQGLFALKVAANALPYYKDYFGIAYPLQKLDLIAIADFAFSAMENWGLITYRETSLLVDTQNTSTDRKQYIALVVAHELAHQWFGNLVTMEWWTHLWLNEGFASFIEYLCVDFIFPEYLIWNQFVADVYTKALDLDGLHNSHAIEVPVGHPSEIDQIFDDISYNKGAAVIRMLHTFIGDELFRKGMNHYLTRHSYKNALTEDLWTALEEVSSKPVRDLMSTWTKQKGFPVITVSSRNVGDSLVLSLTQEKFCADGKVPSSESGVLWMIPISVSTASAPNQTVYEGLMSTKTFEIELKNINSNDWVKLNPDSVGVYRVQYSPEMLSLLLPSVRDRSLLSINRLSLQNDLLAMVQSGRASTVQLLELMEAFSNEDNYTVWNSLNTSLGKVSQLLSHTELLPPFQAYGRQLLSKIYLRLGWETIKGESHLDTLLRSVIINRLVSFDDQNVISEAKKLFTSYTSRATVISADLRSAVYRAVSIDCDDNTFETLFKLYRESDLHEEKDRISRALGAVKDPNSIAKILEFSMSKEVRNQDTVFVLISVSMTKPGRELVFDFFKENKNEFKRRYNGTVLISRFVKQIFENFASEQIAREVEEFFVQNPFPGTERAVQQALETIRLNAEWIARDIDSIETYLAVFSQVIDT